MTDSTEEIRVFEADMLTTGQYYAITINPDNTHQYHLEGATRLQHVITYLNVNHLKKWNRDGIEYNLFPEISMPGEDNAKGITRVHYHGTIKFNKVGLFNFYMKYINDLKKSCMVCIKTMDEGWKGYYTKNHQTMRMLCKYAKCPYELNNLVPYAPDAIIQYLKELRSIERANKKTLQKELYRKSKE